MCGRGFGCSDFRRFCKWCWVGNTALNISVVSRRERALANTIHTANICANGKFNIYPATLSLYYKLLLFPRASHHGEGSQRAELQQLTRATLSLEHFVFSERSPFPSSDKEEQGKTTLPGPDCCWDEQSQSGKEPQCLSVSTVRYTQ